MNQRPALEGLRVIDLSRVLAGPLSAQILADLGADVIKVERPVRGDDTREWAPPTMVQSPESVMNESVYFWSCNRGKRSITADLSDKAGRELILRLVKDADVLIENYKVGTLSRYGLDFETLSALNPKLIYCSITGFGQTGPYAERPGYDTIVQALGGLMSITGNADGTPGGGPRKAGVAVSDQLTALYSVVSILAAANERHVSGLGQHIDMSLLDVQVAALSNLGMGYLNTGVVPQRLGNRLSTAFPSDSYRCTNGEIMLIVGNDEQFRRFCEVMGVPEMASDPRFIKNGSRLQHADILNPLVAQTFAQRTLEECQRLLNEAGVPAAPINNIAQVFNDPQVIARHMVQEIKRPDGRTARVLASPIRMSRSPLRKPELPPLLGEHTCQVTDGWSPNQPSDLRPGHPWLLVCSNNHKEQ